MIMLVALLFFGLFSLPSKETEVRYTPIQSCRGMEVDQCSTKSTRYEQNLTVLQVELRLHIFVKESL